MERKVAEYCATASVLGMISAGTAFAGEAAKDMSCSSPSSTPIALGIVSAVFTIITRIYMTVSFGRSGSKIIVVLSWLASVIAVVLLLVAVTYTATTQNKKDLSGCLPLKPGYFVGGDILAFLSAFLGIGAYISSRPQPSISVIFGNGAYIISTPPPPQTTTNSAPAPAPTSPMDANFDPEKSPMPFAQSYSAQEYPPHQNATQNYPPHQNATPQYPPHQNPTQNYPSHQNPTQSYPPRQQHY